jgi:hypothetical protein
MKRLKLVMIFLFVLPLSGCVNEYNLTDKQSDEVAEYMAGTLLENDKEYDQKLILPDNVQTEDINTAAVTQSPSQTSLPDNTASESDNNNAAETKKNYTLTEVIGKKGFSVKYIAYKLTEAYPENAESTYFTIEPRENYKLLVLSFKVTNTADKAKTFSPSNDDILYKLKVNDSTTYKPLLTLLKNDLQYIEVNIGSGESKNVLLVFEVPKASDLSAMKFAASKGNKAGYIILK